MAGVLIGWYRRLRLFCDPFLNALYATPRIAMVPLIIIWFGIGIWSKVFIVFLSAFFPILVNTVAACGRWIGICSGRASLLRFRLADFQNACDSRIGALHPHRHPARRCAGTDRRGGRRNGGSSEGIGFMVVYGGQTFNTDTLFVGMIVIALSRILLTWLAERLERRFSRWRPER